MEQPVFIIDVSNLFIRSYVVFPTMSTHGYQMGGCIGFLKSLAKLARENKPSRIFCVWEGGGSQRRRNLYSEYKMNRKPEKLNRFYEDNIPDSEDNKKYQMLSLLGMLKQIPVCQLYVSDCEADDVISYICSSSLKHVQKTIVSSDKDMFQLLNHNTNMYSPHKKEFITKERVFEDYAIQTKHFGLAKALCGDPSDNIPGVKGLGFKTISKKFPVLQSEDDIVLQDIIDYASTHSDESQVYKKVVENIDLIKRNWKLVSLDGGMFSHSQASKIDHVIETYEPKINRIELVRLLAKDGINDFDISMFLHAFDSVFAYNQPKEIA